MLVGFGLTSAKLENMVPKFSRNASAVKNLPIGTKMQVLNKLASNYCAAFVLQGFSGYFTHFIFCDFTHPNHAADPAAGRLKSKRKFHSTAGHCAVAIESTD